MVWLPPGTGKSELVDRLFGSYLTAIRPHHTVGVVSYGAMLAQEMTRDAREYYAEFGGSLHPAQKAKTRWKTLHGGGMWGAGFGGAVRGLRYHFGIVDDPHKGLDDIDSDLKRERLFRWWDSVWLNRGHMYSECPISRIIVMQRLADNDLCGWLLSRPDAGKWTVLALDAVHDKESPMLPENAVKQGTVLLPDWREHGDLLCPSRLTSDDLETQRADLDSYLAQYQQRPRPRSGQIIQPGWFPTCKPADVPRILRKVLGCDLAVSTKETADYTVFFPIGEGVDGRLYLFRPFRDRVEAPDSRKACASLARQHRASVIAVESVAFQLAFVQELRRMPELRGFSVVGVDADRDKESRARGWSPQAEQGQIVLVDDGSGWVETFLDEVLWFPRKKKDQIDAVGIGMTAVRELRPGKYGAG